MILSATKVSRDIQRDAVTVIQDVRTSDIIHICSVSILRKQLEQKSPVRAAGYPFG